MKIAILSHGSDYHTWMIIEESELDACMKDGSIEEGDFLIWFENMKEVKLEKKLIIVGNEALKGENK